MATAAANDARIMVARFPEIFEKLVVDTTPGLNARHCGNNRRHAERRFFALVTRTLSLSKRRINTGHCIRLLQNMK
jgi:hypothetical protein